MPADETAKEDDQLRAPAGSQAYRSAPCRSISEVGGEAGCEVVGGEVDDGVRLHESEEEVERRHADARERGAASVRVREVSGALGRWLKPGQAETPTPAVFS